MIMKYLFHLKLFIYPLIIKIYRGYHHEDLTLKFLKENTTKYIAKITGAEFCDEINVELINLKPKVLRIDYGIKKKDKIILYEFLSTKSNIANILRRIFLYVPESDMIIS